ncbi:hypothetical protein TIFTF001_022645 [Ficus carica]|uniref:DNA/RNA-binding protein Alba-like domain-containing protein n=1 Tax=Ficus carica TaxID=3494 RepID=A0AA88DBV6_FICCA|nr:hypothetical protein TIFTF001_022645 [Ficus carica]
MEVVSNVPVYEGSEVKEFLTSTELESGSNNGGQSKTASDEFESGGSNGGESKSASDDSDGGGSNGDESKTSSDDSGGGGSNGGENKTSLEDSDLELCKGKIRIQVSKNKRPLFFYINLAKKYLRQYYDVELTALGLAIPTVIIISEFLKRHGLAVEKSIGTSTVVGGKDESKGRLPVKAQIHIQLGLAEKQEERLVVAVSSN